MIPDWALFVAIAAVGGAIVAAGLVLAYRVWIADAGTYARSAPKPVRLSGDVRTAHCERCGSTTWHQDGQCLRCWHLAVRKG